ncbi:MAG: hypothetical protein J0H09_22535 [Burkholderiales bacterium]|nr:hypothetical protein [Burkholderiales bacterium]
MARRHSHALSSARKLGELGLAAPQVVTHRLAQAALNGPIYSSKDRREFIGMVHEKQVAFMQSWLAMAQESWKVQQRLWFWWAGSLAWPAAAWRRAPLAPDAWLRVSNAGLAPVHRKAVANAKRLARAKTRR